MLELIPVDGQIIDGDAMQKENHDRVTFEQFREALSVFSGDYTIVNHPGLPIRTPWDEPNEAGVYSLTQIPETMTEEEWLQNIGDITDIVVTCMDKDCAHSTWEKTADASKKVLMLSWGGGVVQDVLEDGTDRVTAHATIARYFGDLRQTGKLSKLQRVHAADHDNVCGAVKKFLGKPLHEILSTVLHKEITAHSPEEDAVMEAFVRDGAQPWIQAFAGTGVEVMAELHDTDRIDSKNSAIKLLKLEPGLPQINVAGFRLLNNL